MPHCRKVWLIEGLLGLVSFNTARAVFHIMPHCRKVWLIEGLLGLVSFNTAWAVFHIMPHCRKVWLIEGLPQGFGQPMSGRSPFPLSKPLKVCTDFCLDFPLCSICCFNMLSGVGWESWGRGCSHLIRVGLNHQWDSDGNSLVIMSTDCCRTNGKSRSSPPPPPSSSWVKIGTVPKIGTVDRLAEGRLPQHNEHRIPHSFWKVYEALPTKLGWNGLMTHLTKIPFSLWVLNQFGWRFCRDVISYSFTILKHIQIN